MDDNTVKEQTPAEPNTANGVWISKEEYARLNSLTPMQPVATEAVIGSGPVPSFDVQSTPVKANKKDFWTYASAGAAILIFLMLTSSVGSWITTPAIIAIVIFAILAVKSLVKPKDPYYNLQPSSSNPAPIRAPSNAGKVVGIVLGGLMLVIIAPFALLIIFFMVLASSGAASGS